MIIRAQDIRPGFMLRTKMGNMIVTVRIVHVMSECKSLFTPSGHDPMRLPGCVFIVYLYKGKEYPYTFELDEEVERAFINE